MTLCTAQLLNGFNSLLSAHERSCAVLGLHVDFSKTEKTACLKALYTCSRVSEMLEGNSNSAIDIY